MPALQAPPALARSVEIEGPGRAHLRDERIPVPARGQALVRVEGCGVCGSDLPVWEGRPWFSYPLPPGAPGHEGWGEVVSAAGGVDSPRAGTRVAFLSDRSLAEYVVADAEALVPLPPELDGVPFPGEAFGCAFNVLRRSDIRPRQRVAVVGVGFLGAVLVALAVEAGARVTAFARRPFARRVAAELGAEHAVPLEDAPAREFDRVLEVGGAQATLDLASSLVATRGRLVIAGYHQDGPRNVDLQSWNWRGIDVVNAHERDPAVYVRGMREAVDAAAGRRLDARAFVTHEFPLVRAAEAFEAARTRPDGFLKAVVLT